ncbi:MAG: type II secretion system F family protein [Hyphomicrobium sp.]
MAENDILPLVAALLGAGALAAVVFVLLYPFISGDKDREKRISNVTEGRASKMATRSAAEVAANRRKQVADTLKDIEKRDKSKEKVSLRLRMQRAGLEGDPKSFWTASALCGVVCGGLTFFSIANPAVAMISAFATAFVGTFGLPRFILSKMIQRRQNKFLHEMANAIDVVVRGVKSGLPLNECLQVISRESPEPIGSEFKEVVEQQRIGVPLAEALERLINRMPLAEVKFLAIVISIQAQAGGNLSEALGNLSNVLRDRIRMKMKIKALSAEAKSSAAVLASLPPGVMTMLTMSAPDYIEPLYNTSAGLMIIAAGLFWMFLGVMVMRKMINFKF